jgi:hypothetical protein
MVTLVLVNLISEMVGFIGGIITKARVPMKRLFIAYRVTPFHAVPRSRASYV